MVFRRRRETDEQADPVDPVDLDDDFDDFDEDDPSDAVDADDPDARYDEDYAVAVAPRPTGPWDSHDAPEDEVPRVDLGGMLMPVPDGLEVRVEVQDDVPVAASLIDGNSQLQVHAFAAPKSSGLWTEVRTEIAASLKSAGGTADDADGPFGVELRARIPVENGATQPARFLGVDGPRWFLRGLLTGPGSTDASQAKRLEDAFRHVVVQRGGDAMAPRDMLPLHLPREAVELPLPPVPDRTLRLPERGPEITEIQ
ncbi:MAG TPA: DUF3710 domain-containing protein [Mycobacteriales bacterium]|jgi:hypothetical protein|nr:DUF3710 domain-containing protein [Mycobacteriales bacterium]